MSTPDEEAGHDVPASDERSAVNTLYNQLLARFENGAALEPSDVYFIVGQLHESLPLEVRVKAAAIIAGSTGKDLDYVHAGAVRLLVPMLNMGAESDAAQQAALEACRRLAFSAQDDLVEKGAVPPLVKLLPGPHGERAVRLLCLLGQVLPGKRAHPFTAKAKAAIFDAGGIPPLVSLLLSASTESATAKSAMMIIFHLVAYTYQTFRPGGEGTESQNITDWRKLAIVDAGGIEALLVHASRDPPVSTEAAQALRMLIEGTQSREVVPAGAALVLMKARLKGVSLLPARGDDAPALKSLCRSLAKVAESRLEEAVAGGAGLTATKEAIAEAKLVRVDDSKLDPALTRVRELELARRRARRESVLANCERPYEHLCPIELRPMQDPVVASDGNTYERGAIEKHIAFAKSAGKPLRSPLTNDDKVVLTEVLIPNNNLRKLIQDFEVQNDRLDAEIKKRYVKAVEAAQEEDEEDEDAQAENVPLSQSNEAARIDRQQRLERMQRLERERAPLRRAPGGRRLDNTPPVDFAQAMEDRLARAKAEEKAKKKKAAAKAKAKAAAKAKAEAEAMAQETQANGPPPPPPGHEATAAADAARAAAAESAAAALAASSSTAASCASSEQIDLTDGD